MVRMTIACAWCRRSKIKCIHEGAPPCRNCLKSGRTSDGDCILSKPDLLTPSQSKGEFKSSSKNKARRPEALDKNLPGLHVPTAGNPEKPAETTTTSIPEIVLRQSVIAFKGLFPELGFVHLATLSTTTADKSNDLLHRTIVVVCAAMNAMPTLSTSTIEDPEALRQELCSTLHMFGPPNLNIVQALLVFSMYDWGNGKAYSAWMMTGAAIRMMQSLQTLQKLKASTVNENTQQIYNRTFWGCFVMDRLIICGSNQPLTLPLDQMIIHLPVGELDFTFGQCSDPRITIKDIIRADCHDHTSIDHYYSILVRGFDIWARILKWRISGGRRQPGMCLLPKCPWVSGSPWKILYDDLKKWRSSQAQRMLYPTTAVAAHVSLGTAHAFAFVNLIYFISLQFLTREYIPFLPTVLSEPRGPVDPPLLEAVAPVDWWNDQAGQGFDSSAQITNLLQQLEDLGSPLMTPFAGFCSFSAAVANVYVFHFPRMNLGRSASTAAALVDMNLAYMHRFKGMWKSGNGWCKSIEASGQLYSRAIKDQQRYRGKSYNDYKSLEASLHDYGGVSPPENDTTEDVDQRNAAPSQSHETEAAIGLHQLSHSEDYLQQLVGELDLPADISLSGQWNEMWPLWDDEQLTTYGYSGIPTEYDLGFPQL